MPDGRLLENREEQEPGVHARDAAIAFVMMVNDRFNDRDQSETQTR